MIKKKEGYTDANRVGLMTFENVKNKEEYVRIVLHLHRLVT